MHTRVARSATHDKTGVRRSRRSNYPAASHLRLNRANQRCATGVLCEAFGHTLAVFNSTYAAWIDADSDRDEIERILAATGPPLAR